MIPPHIKELFYGLIRDHLKEKSCKHCNLLIREINDCSINYFLLPIDTVQKHLEETNCRHCKNLLAEIFMHTDPTGENLRRIRVLYEIEDMKK